MMIILKEMITMIIMMMMIIIIIIIIISRGYDAVYLVHNFPNDQCIRIIGFRVTKGSVYFLIEERT